MSESLGKPPFLSSLRPVGGRRQTLTMQTHRQRFPSYPTDRMDDPYGSLSSLLGISLLRVLSRSEDEATRKNVILNPFTPYDVLSELENQFTELFVNNPALESYNSMKL